MKGARVTPESDELLVGNVVRKALVGSLVIRNWPRFQELMYDCVHKVEDADEDELMKQLFTQRLRSKLGKDYQNKILPEAQGIPPETFGVSVWSCDGQFLELGDAGKVTCVASSIIWPVVLTHLRRGPDFAEELLMGREPSGLAEDAAILNRDGLPYSPFMVTGELVLCQQLLVQAKEALSLDMIQACRTAKGAPELSIIKSVMESTGFLSFWRALCVCEKVEIEESVYVKHWDNYRTRGILYLLLDTQKKFDASLTEVTLAIWCALRSIQVTTSTVAWIAATFANKGATPMGDKIFQQGVAQVRMSILFSCGADWGAGAAQCSIGAPVKTSRNGMCMLIVPGVLGLCVLSPVCDLYENSLKGMYFLQEFTKTFSVHAYEHPDWDLSGSRWDLQKYHGASCYTIGHQTVVAAENHDLNTLQEFSSMGVDLNFADYDGRTPMHIAAKEGHKRVVCWLLEHNVNAVPVDRWGRRPLDEAVCNGHCEVALVLNDPESARYRAEDLDDNASCYTASTGAPTRSRTKSC